MTSMTTERSPSAAEACEMWLKAPKKASEWTLSKQFLSYMNLSKGQTSGGKDREGRKRKGASESLQYFCFSLYVYELQLT